MIFLFTLSYAGLIICLHKKTLFHFTSIDLFFTLWISWCGIRFFTSNTPTPDTGILLESLGLCLWYIFLRTNYQTRNILLVFIPAGICQAIIGILQHGGLIALRNTYFTFTGSFENPGPYGGFLAMAFLITITYTWLHWHHFPLKQKIIALTILVTQLYPLIGSNSGASWLAIIVGILYFFHHYLYHLRKFQCRITECIIILFSGIALFFFRPDSATGRIQIWQAAINMYQKVPIIGHGIDSFPATYMNAQAEFLNNNTNTLNEYLASNNTYAFNEFIRIACEQGCIGLILFCTLLLVLFLPPTTTTHGKIAKTTLGGFFIFACFSYPAEILSLKIIFISLIATLANDAKPMYTFHTHRNAMYKFTGIIIGICLVPVILEYKSRIDIDQKLHSLSISTNKTPDTLLQKHYNKYKFCKDFILAYSHILYHAQKYKEAQPLLEQAALLQPTTDILCDLGNCHARHGNFDNAQLCFKQAIRMVPCYLMPRYQLFCLYKEHNKTELAKSIAQEILALKPKITNSTTLSIKKIVRTWCKNNS